MIIKKIFLDFKTSKNSLVFLIPFLISFLIFFPILLGKNFPLWSSDNLFGIYPFIEISRLMLSDNNSTWFPLLGRGIDFSASVNNLTYSPILNLLMKFNTKYLYISVFFTIFIAFYFIGVVTYFVIFNYTNEKYSSIFGASIYQLSFASLYYLQTFPNTILQLSFLLSILIIQKIDKLPFLFSLSCLSLTLSTLILTGHTAYSFYFCCGIFIFFIYEFFFISKKQKKLIFVFLSAFFLSSLISMVKIFPFFHEVIGGSRVTSHFIPPILFRPLSFLQQFFPDTFAASIYKSFYLGEYKLENGSIHQKLAMDHAHATYLYIGIIPMLFSIIHIFLKKNIFFAVVSLFFILETFFPLFGIISNAIFFPFQHGSHIYLACLFWAISSSFVFNNIINKKDLRLIQKISKTTVIISLLLFILITTIFFIYFFDYDLFYQKLLLILYLFIFYFLIKKLVTEKKYNEKFIFNIALMSSIIILFFFFFLSPIGRLNLICYAISIFLIFYIFRLQLLRDNKKIIVFWLNFFVIVLNISIYYFLISPYIPSLSGSEDFLNTEYFRVRNQYSEVLIWRHEWFVLMFSSLLKFIFIIITFLFFLNILRKKNKFLITNILFILLAIDLIPVFFAKSNWITKSFVKVNYMNLFPNVENMKNDKNFKYRFSNSHSGIMESNIFKSENEGEVLSNLPYAHGYPSYGGVNSQFPLRQVNFFKSYINQKKSDLKPNKQTAFDIGLSTDFLDERLLKILGVKYIFQKDEELNFYSTPTILSSKNDFQIIGFKKFFYIIKNDQKNKNVEYLISNLHKNLFSTNSLKIAKCVVEKQFTENEKCIKNNLNKINIKNVNNSLPRFKIYKSAINVNDESEAAKILANEDFNFKDNVLIESNSKKKYRPGNTFILDYKVFNNDNLRVYLNGNCNDCILLFNDSYNKNWQASYKNKEYKVYPANGISNGILIDDNPLYVDLKFLPQFRQQFLIINQIILTLLKFIFVIYLAFFIKKKYFFRKKLR